MGNCKTGKYKYYMKKKTIPLQWLHLCQMAVKSLQHEEQAAGLPENTAGSESPCCDFLLLPVCFASGRLVSDDVLYTLKTVSC